MNTPICDFVRRYAEQNALRLHMPGHKGSGALSVEYLDITEIEGADSLYEASGIIRESEQNASRLFGCDTFYSTEGSSLCIRAMLYLTALYAKAQGKNPLILAGRNAHKTFLSAVALLDFDVEWLYPESTDSYLSCKVDAHKLAETLSEATELPTAVYLTSPDYLGNTAHIQKIAEVCHKHGVLLLVDNAHGAYFKFLPTSQHPMDLGADMCCDSAHKTLPVLTGGAYLHISESSPEIFSKQAKNALSLFGSTSPSYLILESLDAANKYLAEGYKEKLSAFIPKVQKLKDKLSGNGYSLQGNEDLKITISTKPYGYSGRTFANILSENNIICEFADPDFVVMMLTPEIGAEGLQRLEDVLLSINKLSPIADKAPVFNIPEKVVSVRSATLCDSETIPVAKSLGRILSAATVGCPPAVPIVVCGEKIDNSAVECFRYYGIESCTVIK